MIMCIVCVCVLHVCVRVGAPTNIEVCRSYCGASHDRMFCACMCIACVCTLFVYVYCMCMYAGTQQTQRCVAVVVRIHCGRAFGVCICVACMCARAVLACVELARHAAADINTSLAIHLLCSTM